MVGIAFSSQVAEALVCISTVRSINNYSKSAMSSASMLMSWRYVSARFEVSIHKELSSALLRSSRYRRDGISYLLQIRWLAVVG